MKCKHGIIATFGLLAFGLGSFVGIGGAVALDYPTRPVHWIVGYPAGGSTDIVARLMGQYLSEKLGQQFIIENRPGAGNNIGTEAVVRAPADGYTLLLINPPNPLTITSYQIFIFISSAATPPSQGLFRLPILLKINPPWPRRRLPGSIASP